MPTRQANRWHDDDGRLIFEGDEWDLLAEYVRLRAMLAAKEGAIENLSAETERQRQQLASCEMELGPYRRAATAAGANDERHT